MFTQFNISDPSYTSFYVPIILSLIMILGFLEFIIHILKSRQEFLNRTTDNTLQQGLIYSHTFIIRKNTLNRNESTLKRCYSIILISFKISRINIAVHKV